MEDTASSLTPSMGPEFPKPLPPADDLGISWREYQDVESALQQARAADSHRIHEHGGGGGGHLDAAVETRLMRETLQEALGSVSGGISDANLGRFLEPEFLLDRGFVNAAGTGPDYRKPEEFDPNKDQAYRKWIKAVFGPIHDQGMSLTEGVRNFMHLKINRDKDLDKPTQKEPFNDLVDGLWYLHNYESAWNSCNGEIGTFMKSISESEADRFNTKHLHQICKLFPGTAKAISLMDQWAATQAYPADGWSKTERILKERGYQTPEDFCDSLTEAQMGIVGIRPEEVVYQKHLAKVMFKVLGFLDVRNYQAKHERYAEMMPRSDKELTARGGREQYNKAINFSRWGDDYDSPYTFLMDPLGLIQGVQNNYTDIIDDMRVGIREFNSPHNVFNLGWRPVAWYMLERFAGGIERSTSISADDLGDHSLVVGGRTLADLTDREWRILEITTDIQKESFKNAGKAWKAVTSLMECFQLNPGKFPEFYDAIGSYLRADANRTDAGDFNRNDIMQACTEGILEIVRYLVKHDDYLLPIKESDMKLVVLSIKRRVAPAKPFTERQEREFLKSCSFDTSDFVSMALANIFKKT